MEEFEQKYFPPEARDRLAQEFLRLEQGEKSVREYEAEFMRLQRYVSYCNVDDKALVRQFMQGLKPEIGSRLQSATFTNPHEIIERAVNVEAYLLKEKAAWNKRKIESKTASKAKKANQSSNQPNPSKGGQPSGDENKKCYTCGKMGHVARMCYRNRPAGASAKCFSCGEQGHYSNACPRKAGGAAKGADKEASTRPMKESPANRLTNTGKVYALESGPSNPSGQTQGPITGSNLTHVLFDSGATHSFVTPEVASRFGDAYKIGLVEVNILTPGDQVLKASRVVFGVPVELQGDTLKADLLVLPLARFEVFWSILEHMGHKEHGGTWHMEAAQLDTQRKKGEAILKTSSTV
ncbi:unnamed protein product [Microthlaspi erraticum]|uniref:CCHC-type domain-containing protein n=1 Tax=Microthlaspi erraticum TaxID=1685480 RepID=A0A6D2IXY8_9BRAS|nr:unnamed protein product [Microthlaspi erraticum]